MCFDKMHVLCCAPSAPGQQLLHVLCSMLSGEFAAPCVLEELFYDSIS